MKTKRKTYRKSRGRNTHKRKKRTIKRSRRRTIKRSRRRTKINHKYNKKGGYFGSRFVWLLFPRIYGLILDLPEKIRQLEQILDRDQTLQPAIKKKIQEFVQSEMIKNKNWGAMEEKEKDDVYNKYKSELRVAPGHFERRVAAARNRQPKYPIQPFQYFKDAHSNYKNKHKT